MGKFEYEVLQWVSKWVPEEEPREVIGPFGIKRVVQPPPFRGKWDRYWTWGSHRINGTLCEILNKIGADGWRVVANNENKWFLLERELQND